jgi:primosomal protein N''
MFSDTLLAQHPKLQHTRFQPPFLSLRTLSFVTAMEHTVSLLSDSRLQGPNASPQCVCRTRTRIRSCPSRRRNHHEFEGRLVATDREGEMRMRAETARDRRVQDVDGCPYGAHNRGLRPRTSRGREESAAPLAVASRLGVGWPR